MKSYKSKRNTLKCNWLFAASFILIAQYGISQEGFQLGLRGGLIASQVAGDNQAGFDKLGFFFAPSVERKLNENSSFEIGLQFSAKGSRKNRNPAKNDFESYLLQLPYIEMPILYKFHQDKFIYSLGIGPEFLINSREVDNDGIVLNSQDEFNDISVCLYIGMDYELGERSFLSFRFSNSLTPLRNGIATGTNQLNFWRRIFNKGQYNTVLEFGFKRLIG